MRNGIIFTSVALLISCLLTAGAGGVLAGDERDRFSLGYGSLTPTRTDPRDERYGLLTARYRLGSDGSFRLYLGTGLAYSYQPDANPTAPPRIRGGVGGQAGFSYLLGEKALLHLDYKLLEMAPDATRRSGTTTPQSVGVGVEIKF